MRFESPILITARPVRRITLTCRVGQWPTRTHGAILVSQDGQEWRACCACVWGDKGRPVSTLSVQFEQPIAVVTHVKGLAYSEQDFLAELELSWQP